MEKVTLREDVRKIADRLRSIAEQVAAEVSRPAPGAVEAGDRQAAAVGRARATLKLRRRRNAVFQTPGLFGEPAWDMMLDLFVSEHERKSTYVTAACIAADVPTTTALRYLQVLEKAGLIEFSRDPEDGRRRLVTLTRSGSDHVRATLDG